MTPTITIPEDDNAWSFDENTRRLAVRGEHITTVYRLPSSAARVSMTTGQTNERLTVGGFKSTTLTIVGRRGPIARIAATFGI